LGVVAAQIWDVADQTCLILPVLNRIHLNPDYSPMLGDES
jgi:hypothetical protein